MLGRCLPRMAKEVFCLEKSETAGAICALAGLFWSGCAEYVCICVACFLVRLTLFNGNNLQKVFVIQRKYVLLYIGKRDKRK